MKRADRAWSEEHSGWPRLRGIPKNVKRAENLAAETKTSRRLCSCTCLCLCLVIWNIVSSVLLLHILIRVKETDKTLRNLPRDGIARQDFAWRYNGARIVDSLTTPISADQTNSPFIAIDDDIRPGRCWPFPGRTGQLGIKFPCPVIVTHISIDHVAKEVALDMQNAPGRIMVWGFSDSQNSFPHIHPQARSPVQPSINDPNLTFLPIAMFRYDIHAHNHIQTFPVLQEIATAGFAFHGVVVEVLDNWGGEVTCIYRVRVHGHLEDI